MWKICLCELNKSASWVFSSWKTQSSAVCRLAKEVSAHQSAMLLFTFSIMHCYFKPQNSHLLLWPECSINPRCVQKQVVGFVKTKLGVENVTIEHRRELFVVVRFLIFCTSFSSDCSDRNRTFSSCSVNAASVWTSSQHLIQFPSSFTFVFSLSFLERWRAVTFLCVDIFHPYRRLCKTFLLLPECASTTLLCGF